LRGSSEALDGLRRYRLAAPGKRVIDARASIALAAPRSQLAPLNVDESTAEAIGDWHYWVMQGDYL
jgi:hypothetical protein